MTSWPGFPRTGGRGRTGPRCSVQNGSSDSRNRPDARANAVSASASTRRGADSAPSALATARENASRVPRAFPASRKASPARRNARTRFLASSIAAATVNAPETARRAFERSPSPIAETAVRVNASARSFTLSIRFAAAIADSNARPAPAASSIRLGNRIEGKESAGAVSAKRVRAAMWWRRQEFLRFPVASERCLGHGKASQHLDALAGVAVPAAHHIRSGSGGIKAPGGDLRARDRGMRFDEGELVRYSFGGLQRVLEPSGRQVGVHDRGDRIRLKNGHVPRSRLAVPARSQMPTISPTASQAPATSPFPARATPMKYIASMRKYVCPMLPAAARAPDRLPAEACTAETAASDRPRPLPGGRVRAVTKAPSRSPSSACIRTVL